MPFSFEDALVAPQSITGKHFGWSRQLYKIGLLGAVLQQSHWKHSSKFGFPNTSATTLLRSKHSHRYHLSSSSFGSLSFYYFRDCKTFSHILVKYLKRFKWLEKFHKLTLASSIPLELGLLTNLQILDLGKNSLHGYIQHSWDAFLVWGISIYKSINWWETFPVFWEIVQNSKHSL